ncbi:MAG: hypothetical protein K8F62_15410 [Pseudorhodoplanes sp.]|nr:hypothetical protein [Pseudorhodoplanes sp.]
MNTLVIYLRQLAYDLTQIARSCKDQAVVEKLEALAQQMIEKAAEFESRT